MLYTPYRSLFKKVIIALLFLPILAYAEVSDKEPSVLYIWSIGAISAAVCFFGAYYRRWLLAVLVPAPALWFVSLFIEIHSTDVGLALYQEQGIVYYLQAYLSLLLFTFGSGIGWLINGKRKNFQK